MLARPSDDAKVKFVFKTCWHLFLMKGPPNLLTISTHQNAMLENLGVLTAHLEMLRKNEAFSLHSQTTALLCQLWHFAHLADFFPAKAEIL